MKWDSNKEDIAKAIQIRVPLLTAVVTCILLAGVLCLIVGTIAGLTNFRDVGYPDSANLLRVGDFVHSGRIYPDFNVPPYLVSIYGPLNYVALGIPYALGEAAGFSPQITVRFGVLIAFAACVSLVFVIARRLYGNSPVAWLSALFALSIVPAAAWTTQIRGDFFAIALSFLALYLVLHTNGRWRFAGAMICAGFSLLIKQTFIAVPVTIAVWLISQRRHRKAVLWSVAIILIVAGGYAVAWWREPLMLRHLFAISSPVLEYRGAEIFLAIALSQPVVPFSVLGAILVFWKGTTETILLAIFWVFSWLIAAVSVLQVGGSVNYFMQPLLASALLAGHALQQVDNEVNSVGRPIKVFVVVLLLWSWIPLLREEIAFLKESYRDALSYRKRKADWTAFASVVSNHKVLSTIPSISVLSKSPELPDPYLNSVLELRGRWSSAPIVAKLEAGGYDLIAVRRDHIDRPYGYRGVHHWSPRVRRAVKAKYALACMFENVEVWLPHQSSGDLLSRLSSVGCK